MARSRNIKPGFFKNELLAECSPWARLLFIGLWCMADRAGRLEDRPKRIKAELFAFESFPVSPLLDELQSLGFITRYTVDDGDFIQVVNFSKHQNPHYKERASVLPAPGPGFDSQSSDDKPGALPPDDDASDSVPIHKPSVEGSHVDDGDENPRHAPGSMADERGANRADSGFLIPDSFKSAPGFATVLRARAHTRTRGDPETEDIPAPPPDHDSPPDNPAEGAGTRYGLAAKAMRLRGIDANPGDARLRKVVDEGGAIEEFEAAADAAIAANKGFAWAMGALIGRRRDAAAMAVARKPAAREPTDWRDTRRGVIERACELGMPPFDTGAERLGTGPTWARYREDVIAAHERQANIAQGSIA
jgi:hypothetical protein